MTSTGVNGHLRRGSIIRIGSVALAAVLTAVGLLTAHGASGAVAAGTTAYVPPVKHVFIINIENKGYDATWVLTVSLDAAQIATGMPTSGRVGRHGEDE